MAGQHLKQERGYTPSRSSLVLATPFRSKHRPSLSELVVGHPPYQPPTGGRRTGEQETEPLNRGEMYVMVWRDGVKGRSYQGAEQ